MINFHIKATINRLVERGERGRTDILFRDTRVLIPAKIINIIVIKVQRAAARVSVTRTRYYFDE